MTETIILLVEDNKKDQALILRALQKGGIKNRIDVVEDGAEALEYLFDANRSDEGKGRELPVLILLDIMMPKVDGHQVLRAIRADERTKMLPVVILTSSDEERDIIEGYSEGANGYVQKPVIYQDFMETVKNIGLFWLLSNTPPPQPEP